MKSLEKDIIPRINELITNLNEISLTGQGKDFYETLKDFNYNPYKYLTGVQPDRDSLQHKFKESDARVEQFIQDAKDKGYLIYYLNLPDKQGFFWDQHKKLEKESQHAYVMVLENQNSQKGKFMMLPNTEIGTRQAISQYPMWVCSVCKTEKIKVENKEDKGVEQRGFGELTLDTSGSKLWRVTNKIDATLYYRPYYG